MRSGQVLTVILVAGPSLGSQGLSVGGGVWWCVVGRVGRGTSANPPPPVRIFFD